MILYCILDECTINHLLLLADVFISMQQQYDGEWCYHGQRSGWLFLVCQWSGDCISHVVSLSPASSDDTYPNSLCYWFFIQITESGNKGPQRNTTINQKENLMESLVAMGGWTVMMEGNEHHTTSSHNNQHKLFFLGRLQWRGVQIKNVEFQCLNMLFGFVIWIDLPIWLTGSWECGR